MTDELILALKVIGFFILLLAALNCKIVRENEAHVVERLGQFRKVVEGPKIFFNVPLVDRVIQVVPLKEQEKTIKLENNETGITHHLHIRYQITNIKLYVYAALDSEKSLKDYIVNNISLENGYTKTDENLIYDQAQLLGMEIIEVLFK